MSDLRISSLVLFLVGAVALFWGVPDAIWDIITLSFALPYCQPFGPNICFQSVGPSDPTLFSFLVGPVLTALGIACIWAGRRMSKQTTTPSEAEVKTTL
jgi:hypothetical protein